MSNPRDLNPIEVVGTFVAAAATAPLAFGLVVAFLVFQFGPPTLGKPDWTPTRYR